MALQHHAPHLVHLGIDRAQQRLFFHGIAHCHLRHLAVVLDNIFDDFAKSQHAHDGAALNGRAIISLFTDDADIITQVAQLFLISLILEPGRTFNLVVINALRATGDARFPLYMALVSMWGIAVPLAYFLGIMQGYGLVGIWLALACDEWVRGLAMFWRWRSRRWQNKILVET